MEKSQTKKNAVEVACFLAGGQVSVSRLMNANGISIRPQSIQQWCANGRVPPKRVREFCRVTGAKPADVNPIFKDI